MDSIKKRKGDHPVVFKHHQGTVNIINSHNVWNGQTDIMTLEQSSEMLIGLKW